MSSIESALHDLGTEIEYPTTPDFDKPAVTRRPSLWWAVAAAVILLALVTTTVPAVRDQLAAWFGIRGVGIERTQSVDLLDRLPGEVLLGEAVTIDEAPFVPVTLGALGDPAAVFLDDESRLTLLYDIEGEIVLLTEFVADLEPAILKQVGVETVIEPVSVEGVPAIWIAAGPHSVFFLNAEGEVDEARSWLSGPTLLWEVGDLTLRLEGVADRQQAIDIAESVVP